MEQPGAGSTRGLELISIFFLQSHCLSMDPRKALWLLPVNVTVGTWAFRREIYDAILPFPIMLCGCMDGCVQDCPNHATDLDLQSYESWRMKENKVWADRGFLFINLRSGEQAPIHWFNSKIFIMAGPKLETQAPTWAQRPNCLCHHCCLQESASAESCS